MNFCIVVEDQPLAAGVKGSMEEWNVGPLYCLAHLYKEHGWISSKAFHYSSYTIETLPMNVLHLFFCMKYDFFVEIQKVYSNDIEQKMRFLKKEQTKAFHIL